MAPNPFAGRVDDELLDQLRYLFRKVVPGLRRRLVNRVGTGLRVELVEASSATLGECLDQASQTPAALGEYDLSPKIRAGVLLDGTVLARLLGMMLGESEKEARVTERQVLTRVDLRIGKRFCEDLVATMGEQTGLEREIVLLDVRPAPRTLSWMTRSTRVLVATLEFGPQDEPFGRAKVLLPLQSTSLLFGTAPPLGEARQARMESVLPVQMEVVAELARVKVAISGLSNLVEGSLIDLGRPGDVMLSVNGKPTFHAEGGEADGTRSVRILGRASASA